jgi:hypothetical protein
MDTYTKAQIAAHIAAFFLALFDNVRDLLVTYKPEHPPLAQWWAEYLAAEANDGGGTNRAKLYADAVDQSVGIFDNIEKEVEESLSVSRSPVLLPIPN